MVLGHLLVAEVREQPVGLELDVLAHLGPRRTFSAAVDRPHRVLKISDFVRTKYL